MEYRKDIQILRGIAVLLVVLFHFQFAGFKSGFLGVDVFFVISGYLMAVIYIPSNARDFFVKRARRLLPAYFTVVIFTLLIALIVTIPNDFEQVSNQAVFATFFASNIGFWLENSYFDKAAFKPLLHLWSLAVEIQFYLLVPGLFWAFRGLKASVLLTMLASAALCFVIVGISPKTSFFWLPLRLWEFLIGFGVATYVSKWRLRDTQALTWLGAASLLGIVCIPSLDIDGTALGFVHGHPGLVALLISLAAASTLSFGLPQILLANPLSALLEKIGNYSYSIYMAHFPVIVLFLYQPFSGTLLKAAGIGQTATLALLVVGASAMLFKFVEQPFRTSRRAPRWVFASACVVLGISQGGAIAQNFLIPEKEMLIYQAWFDRDEFRCGKINRLLAPGAISCEITKPNKAPSRRVLLVGNSYADSIKATFSAAAQAANVSVYFIVENTPLMKDGITPRELVREARARNIDSIVLHYSPHSIEPQDINSLAALARENHLRLSFIMPVPAWDQHVPMALWKSLKGAGAVPSQTIDDYRNFNSALISGLAKIDYDKFRVYQVADVFCRGTCLLISESGRPLYFDGGHLTLTGSAMLRGVFDRVIADLL